MTNTATTSILDVEIWAACGSLLQTSYSLEPLGELIRVLSHVREGFAVRIYDSTQPTRTLVASRDVDGTWIGVE